MNKMSTLAADTQSAIETAPQPPRRSMRQRLLMFSVPLLLLVAGAAWWLTSGGSESTSNAYVKRDIVSISSEVSGVISQVLVDENQHVRAGDILVRIDPQPTEVQLSQAQAQLAAAQVETTQLRTEAAGATVDISGAEDNLGYARRALSRQKKLLDEGFTTRARYDDALHQVQEAEDRLAQARAEAANASAALARNGTQPQLAAAQAAIAKARLDLKRGIIRAPDSGTVVKTEKLLPGAMALPGLSLVSLVRDKGAHVVANFKEGQLAEMRVGQPATIAFDAYPDVKLKGHVASIGAGTGSEFSLLPAQNANGNWVKVTQRVPVRIAIDEQAPREMIAGLSASVTVDTHRR